ncbi:GNAT family N-acetyltransferase [Steroidobacter agaridevorans]|nr:GNAT family N-acetyltransferase [Steroidobacter agaridevorans]
MLVAHAGEYGDAVKNRNVRTANKIRGSITGRELSCPPPLYCVSSGRPTGSLNLRCIGSAYIPTGMLSGNVVLIQAATPELIALTRDLFQEYALAIGIDLEYQGFAAELAALPAPYVSPHGVLFIAYVDGEVAGCAALRPLGDGEGEMKRLYVRPAFRKVGVGRRLVDAIVAAARHAGCHTLRLDTLPSMTSAQTLYRQLGFIETPPYNDKYLPGTRFFALDLRSPQ